VADDKRDGDDLFEDLDKFFAPIRDVDWESEEPQAPEATPQEEHVAVHVPEAAPLEGEPTQVPLGDAAVDDGEDESWYDTSALEPIDELLGEPAEGSVGNEVPAADADQGGLFDTGADDASDDDGALEDDRAPTEQEIEAAAEHFAGSVTVADELEEGPIDEAVTIEGEVVSEATNDDLFGDIHGDNVEQDILADLDDDEDARRTVVVGAEGLGGPSWQEPTSVEVGADLDRRGPNEGERDVPAAVLTGVVLAGIAIGSLLIGPGAFAIVAAIIVLIAQGELFGALVKHHQQPATAIGLVTGVLMIAGAHYHGEPAVLAMFALGVIATFLWFMAAPAAHRQGTIAHIGATLMNIAYIPLLGSYLIVMLGIGGPDGKQLVVAVIGLTFIFDTSAFLVGSVWGGSFFQRPLAPTVSPKKSLEGLIGATLITVIVSMALVPSFVTLFEHKRVEALVLALVIAAAATLGDLAESLIKRDLGIKDMGSILPGHGGVLDRIDSLLFVAPAAFLFFRVIFA
jgi:phosphatidate cytidylyltransferase